jgi:hypothetical protein
MKRDGATISYMAGYDKDNVYFFSLTKLRCIDCGRWHHRYHNGLLLQKAVRNVLLPKHTTFVLATSGAPPSHINTFFDTTYDQIQAILVKKLAHWLQRQLISRGIFSAGTCRSTTLTEAMKKKARLCICRRRKTGRRT